MAPAIGSVGPIGPIGLAATISAATANSRITNVKRRNRSWIVATRDYGSRRRVSAPASLAVLTTSVDSILTAAVNVAHIERLLEVLEIELLLLEMEEEESLCLYRCREASIM